MSATLTEPTRQDSEAGWNWVHYEDPNREGYTWCGIKLPPDAFDLPDDAEVDCVVCAELD